MIYAGINAEICIYTGINADVTLEDGQRTECEDRARILKQNSQFAQRGREVRRDLPNECGREQ